MEIYKRQLIDLVRLAYEEGLSDGQQIGSSVPYVYCDSVKDRKRALWLVSDSLADLWHVLNQNPKPR